MADYFTNMHQNVVQIRDEKRPQIEDVARAIDRIFKQFAAGSDFRQVSTGPDQWSWLDATNISLGYEKWFVLGRSTMGGAEGYPLLTIRQSTAPRLDAWLTISQLVIGPSDREIETSLAMAIANHQGAFEGLKEMISSVIEMAAAAQADNDLPEMDMKKDVN
jgi:hypothetical protein